MRKAIAMKRALALIALVTLMLLWPVLALAEETGLSAAIAGFLQGVVFPVLGALLMALVSWAVVKIAKKYNLDILLQNEALIRNAAWRGIGLAEEYAAKKLKESDIKIGGSEKLSIAVAQVLNAVPKLTREQAEQYIESLLPSLKGVGATGEKTL